MVALRRLFRRANLDVFGFSASAVCAVHCMAVPLLLIMGAFSPAHLAHNHELESGILLVSAVIGTFSLVPSIIRTHNRKMPLILFLLGMAAIVAGRFSLPLLWESLLTTVGAGLVALAHYQNWRVCRSCAVHASGK